MAAFTAARSAFRSASTARTAASKFASAATDAAKPKSSSSSPFRIPTQKPPSHRIFSSPVELSAISVETMLPFHTATASALLNSMLSAAPRSIGWTFDDGNDDV